ncbi:MAG TPA: hypothetical protein VK436_01620 [Methanocella sp.]|nr:hypothetical protein [Methanocella sp.]
MEEEEHIPEGIEPKHRELKEKKESRIGIHAAAEGMGEPGGEGGPSE